MARLMKGERTSSDTRSRRPSFKTRGGDRRTAVRSLRVTVPSNTVTALASKFNAVVVEDELKGRAILKKLNSGQSGHVRELRKVFETLQGPKVVLVRKHHSEEPPSKEDTLKTVKPKIHPKPNLTRKLNGNYVRKDVKELLGKEKRFSLPKTHILDEVLNENSHPSSPKIIKPNSSFLWGGKDKPEEQSTKNVENNKTPVSPSVPKIPESPLFEQTANGSDGTDSLTEALMDIWDSKITVKRKGVEEEKDILNKDIDEEDDRKEKLRIKEVVTATENNELGKPNHSFLWGMKESDSENNISENISQRNITDKIMSKVLEKTEISKLEKLAKLAQKSQLVQTKNEHNIASACVEVVEKPVERKNEKVCKEVKDILVDDKENVEKLETPVVRTVDKKGYGKINPPANSSSLYRNILRQNLLDEIKEKLETKEKTEVLKEKTQENVKEERESFMYRLNGSERSYETVEQNSYEDVGYENNYDVIKDYDDEEAIYDDVLNVTSERVYETIYNGKVQNDSDSSCEQSNSLYELRPPSQASSGSGAVVSATSRSDTSDDWVDIELDSSEEHKEQIVVLQEVHISRNTEGGSWSQKVRRQWSTRTLIHRIALTSSSILYFAYDDSSSYDTTYAHPFPLYTKGLVTLRDCWHSGINYEVQEVTVYILKEDDSDNSSKHYELVEHPDDDSALCDDFDDSSDSEFSSIEQNYKTANNEERLREGGGTEGIYGLMREAGKRVRKTSWSIGKSLRRFSRISKTTVSQDIDNGVSSGQNGLSRGRWPSFKKKTAPTAKSTFYLCPETASSAEEHQPPPSQGPPAPARGAVPLPPDPRRLSLSVRPTSPPPPPPPLAGGTPASSPTNGEPKLIGMKPINDTSLYAECGLFELQQQLQYGGASLDRGSRVPSQTASNSWYSEAGLYLNSTPLDSSSEPDSSQCSDLDLRFADEPLYQFYAERVAKLELADDRSETGYEEIGERRPTESRPSALELVGAEMQRTLWCHIPQVMSSGVLDSLSPERRRLQEAKFELLTSEASYYKSLNILEKNFAASPLLKDETVLPKVDYKTLFGNVSAVKKCSEEVLATLDRCWQESILLEGICGVVYQVAADHFSAYIKYCKHQVAIERTLKNLKKTNTAFTEALNTLQSSPKCHNLSFYSFLLLPMQRITRMPLLLDAILTKLGPDDPEIDQCREALSKLHKIVHECNEAARQTDRLEEMALLSQSLHFPDSVRPLPLLSASRWLVRSGDVTQVCLEPRLTFSRKLTAARSSKLRLFLFTDYLVITKKKGEDYFLVTTYCERNLVHMNDVEETLPNRYLMMLTLLKNHEGKTHELVVCCGGESSRERWTAALTPPSATSPGETLYEAWDCPQVSANHSYTPAQPDELGLQKGDVINVLRKMADGWYYGERTRDAEKGWFPGNHTVEIVSSHVRARNLKQRYRLLALSGTFIQQKQQQMAAKVS